MFPKDGLRIENCFFAKVNDDGSYSEPIPWSGVKEIKVSRPPVDAWMIAWWLLT
jgi:hypothetical protein